MRDLWALLHSDRWMCFVDGENLTIRAQRFAESKGFTLTEGEYHKRDVFVWPGRATPTDVIASSSKIDRRETSIRNYYYTSLVGDEPTIDEVKRALWELGFEGKVFKKASREQKTKGVDIALATDFLSHAFLDNYDVCFLFAGDADYLPLVAEAKHHGKIVCVCFFSEEGLSEKLKLAADYFLPIDDIFESVWRGMAEEATSSDESGEN